MNSGTSTALIGKYAADSALAAVSVVRLHAERLSAPNLARAAEARDDLVVDQQNVMLREHGLHLLEVRARRQQHAADAHQGLRDERRNRVGILALDQLLETRRKPRRVILLGLAGLRAAIVVRRIGMQDAGQRQVEEACGTPAAP